MQFDSKRPTALLLGRFQPFHAGHLALAEAAIEREGQVCIAVRDTAGVDASNPLPFNIVKAKIDAAMAPHAGRYQVVQLPNIARVIYGRDVGYAIERVDLSPELQAISATKIRAEMGL